MALSLFRETLLPVGRPITSLSRPITLSRKPDHVSEIGPMIVITGECPSRPGIHAARVRHHTLPKVFGEGATVGEAAEDLVRKPCVSPAASQAGT